MLHVTPSAGCMPCFLPSFLFLLKVDSEKTEVCLGLLILNVVCVDYERVIERFAYFALSPTLGIQKMRYHTLLN